VVLQDQVLERVLSEADTALQLTLHAMSLATQIFRCGSPDTADKALNIAEQALAATVQQLARAQALVVHKAQLQQMGLAGAAAAAALKAPEEEEDAELQDTCCSSYSFLSSSSQAGGCSLQLLEHRLP
jgi:conjugal transfer/entry exclusion protein